MHKGGYGTVDQTKSHTRGTYVLEASIQPKTMKINRNHAWASQPYMQSMKPRAQSRSSNLIIQIKRSHVYMHACVYSCIYVPVMHAHA